MKRTALLLTAALATWSVTDRVQADWIPEMGHKMHHAQLPDANGWDVDITTDTVYEDFECSATGPIHDVHFWASWQGDQVGQITWIDVSLHADVPAGADPNPLITYSHPDSVMYDEANRLWYRRFLPDEFVIRTAGQGNQGWLAPSFSQPVWNRSDHDLYYQVNIPLITEPYVQKKGTIYWLGLHVGVAETNTQLGWKTTLNPWNDDAAYWYAGQWNELIDPTDGSSLDLAFVITPEPATLSLLLLGVGTILRRR
ncbi:PEP-CTERM sorting domain-containing protein [Mucisphaera sp.]|uniref:PEP-CTERM sorting domain-containing protein n=1 Tax=Mucisphaera sp. TaxID=2913024 RepID=UPI003D0C4E54